MVMEFNVAHASTKKRNKYEGIEIVEEEEDRDVVHEISIVEFATQTRRKEQVEGGKNGEKSHNDGDSLGRDKNSEKPLEDLPPQQHFLMIEY
jgi:hypothetical protein